MIADFKVLWHGRHPAEELFLYRHHHLLKHRRHPADHSQTMDKPHLFTTFFTPSLNSSGFDLGLARAGDRNPNQYLAVLSKGYGFLYSREARRYSIINLTTSSWTSEAPALSENGRPLIWFSAEDDHPGIYGPPGGLLADLLAADKPIIRLKIGRAHV